MRALSRSALSLTLLLSPALAFALTGVGPRVTIEGTVEKVNITEEQRFQNFGGEYVIRDAAGQQITAVLSDDTEIISEGRLSRKQLDPTDVRAGMGLRVRGLRIDETTIEVSLVIVTNVEKNPSLSGNGVIQSIDASSVTILRSDGSVVSLNITGETEVHVSYVIRGIDGLKLTGKQVLYSVNPTTLTTAKVLRITGEPKTKADRPAVREIRSVRTRTR